MTSATTHTIVGFFPSRERAENAVTELVEEGFSRDQVSIIASHTHGGASTTDDAPRIGPIEETGSMNDAGEKAAMGGMAGAILGIAALAIPGVGPILAAGPIAMAITGAAAGAATGGLIGAFTNHGVPEERARTYSKAITSGSVMVSVHAEASQVDQAADVLHEAGAISIDEPNERLDTVTDQTTPARPLPASAIKFDPSTGVRARQKARERHVDVYPGITGSGPNPTY